MGIALLLIALIATQAAAWVGAVLALRLRARLKRLEAQIGGPSADWAAPAAHAPAARATPPAPAAPEPEAEVGPETPPGEHAAPPAERGRPGARKKGGGGLGARKKGGGGLGAVFARIERSLAGNWLVWIAGAALALGGLFLGKYALDAGLLGPWARIGAAALAGAAMLGAAEFLRRRPDFEGAARSLAPPVLAAAGLITLYGDVYAAYAGYGLIGGPVAFALLAGIAALALLLAWLHGPVIAAFGIAGAFAAPLLVGSDDPNLAALLVYVFAVTGASLAAARYAHWRWTAWLSLAGGAGWPALWLLGAFEEGQALALALYLPAFAAAGLAFAWTEAIAPPRVGRAWRAWLKVMPPSVLAAHLCMAASLVLCLWLLVQWRYAAPGVISLFALCALGLGSAWRREGFAFIPFCAAIAAAAAFWFWPDALAMQSVIEAEAQTASTDDEITLTPVIFSMAAFIVLFGAGGYLAQGRLRLKGPMAAASAAAPVAILTVLGFTLPDLAPLWSVALVIAAAIQCGLVELIVRTDRLEKRRPGPAAAYALGTCGAVLAALALSLNEAWLGAAIGLEAWAAAWLWARWRAAALKWAAAGLGLAAAWQLSFGAAEYLEGWTGGWGASIALIAAYGTAALSTEAAARLLRGRRVDRDSAPVRSLEGTAIALAAVTGSILIRLAVNGGALTAETYSLLETGLQVSLWLAIPLALRLRVKNGPTLIQRAAEIVLIAAAMADLIFVHLLWANPWTGSDPQAVYGPPVLNALLIAYGLPAALLAGLAIVWRRRGLRAAPWAALGATFLFFVWATLETRRAFHAPELDAGMVTDAEGWAYSAVWLAGAGLVMAVGAVRRLPVLRYAALAAFTLTTAKVFLGDLSELEGIWRALSFLGLGAVLMLIAVIYQRVILPADRAQARG